MYLSDYAIFIGKEEERYITEFLVENNFYFVFEAKNHLVKEEIRAVVGRIKEEIQLKSPKTLLEFETIIDKEIKTVIKEEVFSLAAGLLVDDVFYLLTMGQGEIYLKKDNKTEKIIAENNSASGHIQDGDFFVFASKNFSFLINKEELSKELNNRSPKDVLENITPKLKEKEDVGVIAVFVKFRKEIQNETSVPELESFDKKPVDQFLDRIRGLVGEISGKKRLTLMVVVVLFLVFLWSVVFGYQRRTHSQLMEKVRASQEKINQKLTEAVDLSTINLQRSLILVAEAKKELVTLQKIVGKKEIKEVKDLEQLIFAREKEIIKKEEKKYEEFYDLALITKKGQGTKLYLDKETVVILNSDSGEIYTLSLTKKSTKTIKGTAIKKATLVALYNDEIFFYQKEEGIYKVGRDGKINLVIKKDDDWGDLIDFWVFNSNLYLLDKNKDEIYKYLVAEEGYSGKTSYFKKGEAIDLAETNSMAIDSSVYIATNNNIYKYTAGVRDEFKVDVPEKDSYSFTKVFTNKNSHKIYLWEKNKGRISILSKDGQYERQINSNIFSRASDFVVLEAEKNIYVLVKDKIYNVGLE